MGGCVFEGGKRPGGKEGANTAALICGAAVADYVKVVYTRLSHTCLPRQTVTTTQHRLRCRTPKLVSSRCTARFCKGSRAVQRNSDTALLRGDLHNLESGPTNGANIPSREIAMYHLFHDNKVLAESSDRTRLEGDISKPSPRGAERPITRVRKEEEEENRGAPQTHAVQAFLD